MLFIHPAIVVLQILENGRRENPSNLLVTYWFHPRWLPVFQSMKNTEKFACPWPARAEEESGAEYGSHCFGARRLFHLWMVQQFVHSKEIIVTWCSKGLASNGAPFLKKYLFILSGSAWAPPSKSTSPHEMKRALISYSNYWLANCNDRYKLLKTFLGISLLYYIMIGRHWSMTKLEQLKERWTKHKLWT